MKRIFVVCFISVFLCNVAYGEDTIRRTSYIEEGKYFLSIFYKDNHEVARQRIEGNGKVVETSGAIPDGRVNFFSESLQMQGEEYYKNGKKEGPCKNYDNESHLVSEGAYKNGEYDGQWKTYYTNGSLMGISYYKEGQPVGISKEYFLNGNLKKEQDKGFIRQYYETGRIREETFQEESDKIIGIIKNYDEEGTLREEKRFEDYAPIHTRKFDAQGKLIEETIH